MNPSRLTRFLDGNSGGERTLERTRSDAYLKSLTVEYASLKGEPFERLKPSKIGIHPDKYAPPGGVLGNPATSQGRLPSPKDHRVVKSASAEAMLPPEQFYLGFAVQPTPVAPEDAPPVDIRKLYEPEGLTLPSVRRKQMIVATQRMNAEKMKRKVAAEHTRMLHLMKTRHPAGLVGVDSPMVSDSVVYGDAGRVAEAAAASKARRQAGRRQALLERTSGAAMRGYNPLAPDAPAEAFVPTAAGTVRPRADAATSGVKIMTAKKRVGLTATGEDTHSHIFQTPEIAPQRAVRLAYIRNNTTRGKEYNPVTGAKYQHYKPEVEPMDKKRVHPALTLTSNLDR